MIETAIKVENISKQYEIVALQRRHNTLRDHLMDKLSGLVKRTQKRCQKQSFWALKDVSFEVKKGELLGIIGCNGAGKSTLLKVLSRVTEPTEGRAVINGRLGSLLEVGTGFSYELSGRENVFLSGAVLGMSKREIVRKFDEIVAFAEVGKHIDTPVKRYSSGMYMRLAFAVASHLDPDILLIDEVLAVGDLAFQRKCLERAKAMRDRASTVLIVSHNMFSIKALCDRVIYLSAGRVQYDGEPDEAIAIYERETRANQNGGELGIISWARSRIGTDPLQCSAYIQKVEILNEKGDPCDIFDHGQRMRIRLHYNSPEGVPKPNFNVSFVRNDDIACCNYNAAMDGFKIRKIQGSGIVELLTPEIKLVAEQYSVLLLIWDVSFQKLYCAQQGPIFHVRHHTFNNHFGIFHEQGQWSHLSDAVKPELCMTRTEIA